MRMTGRVADQGNATVLVIAVAASVLAAGVVGSALGGAIVVRHRAATAVDAAALAAALDVAAGDEPACARAARLARANAASLAGCTFHGAVVDVSITASAGGWLGWLPTVRLNARAGPAETYREKPAPLDPPS